MIRTEVITSIVIQSLSPDDTKLNNIFQMSNAEFTANIKRIEKDVQKYAATTFPNMAARKGLRFIDDNFKNQSWAGLPQIAWQRRKGNKDSGRALLIKKGVLRRSFQAQTSIGQVRIFTHVPYAKAHNEGFRDTVSVQQHTRKKMRKAKVQMIDEFTKSGRHKTKTVQIHEGDSVVSAHSRKMNIKRRQFMPTAERPSSRLNNDVIKQVRNDMYKILKGTFK